MIPAWRVRSNAGASLRRFVMLQLRDDLHWCNSDGRVVFLDVAADRYFCLPGGTNAAFLRLADGTSQDDDAVRLQALIDRGLLIEVAAGSTFRQPPRADALARDVLAGGAARARPAYVFRMLAAELHAGWMLRSRPFRSILDSIRRGSPPSRGRDRTERTIAEIAAAAAAVALLTRSHDRCLVRALAVHRLCRRSGCGAKLVFGVTAHPFSAHCWVERDGLVVVGDHEQARLHAPILVVG